MAASDALCGTGKQTLKLTHWSTGLAVSFSTGWYWGFLRETIIYKKGVMVIKDPVFYYLFTKLISSFISRLGKRQQWKILWIFPLHSVQLGSIHWSRREIQHQFLNVLVAEPRMGGNLVCVCFWLCCSLALCVSAEAPDQGIIWPPNHTFFSADTTLYFLQSGREIAKPFSKPLWHWICIFIQEMNHDHRALL